MCGWCYDDVLCHVLIKFSNWKRTSVNTWLERLQGEGMWKLCVYSFGDNIRPRSFIATMCSVQIHIQKSKYLVFRINESYENPRSRMILGPFQGSIPLKACEWRSLGHACTTSPITWQVKWQSEFHGGWQVGLKLVRVTHGPIFRW